MNFVRIILFILISFCIRQHAEAVTQQRSIDLVEKLAATILEDGISIVSFSSIPDDIRQGEQTISPTQKEQLYLFELGRYRLIKSHFGNATLKTDEMLYYLRPSKSNITRIPKPITFPRNKSRLIYSYSDSIAFLRKESFSNIKLKDISSFSEKTRVKHKTFVSDYQNLEKGNFLQKYNLSDTLERKLFSILNYSVFSLNEEKLGFDSLSESELEDLVLFCKVCSNSKLLSDVNAKLLSIEKQFKTPLAKQIIVFLNSSFFGNEALNDLTKKEAIEFIISNSLLRAIDSKGKVLSHEIDLLKSMKLYYENSPVEYLSIFGKYSSVQQIISDETLLAKLETQFKKDKEKFKVYPLLYFYLHLAKYIEERRLERINSSEKSTDNKTIIEALKFVPLITPDLFASRPFRRKFQKQCSQLYSELDENETVFKGKLVVRFKLSDISSFNRIYLDLHDNSNRLLYYKKTAYPPEMFTKASSDQQKVLLKGNNEIVFENIPLKGSYTFKLNCFIKANEGRSNEKYFGHEYNIKIDTAEGTYFLDLTELIDSNLK